MAEGSRINWLNVITVVSAAILIGAEVFGAAFAGSWAIATLFDLGGLGARMLDGVFVHLRLRHHGAVRPQRASDRAVHHARLSARRRTAKEKVKKVFCRDKLSLACVTKITYFRNAQFRTCLWPCVGR